jgi:CBS domain containing-hemolysin-like protein
MGLLLFYLSLALIISFLCSILEAVLLSTPQSFLMVNQGKGEKWANGFVELKSNIDKPLSAILSLNTVAHTVGAAGVGAEAVKVFGEAYFGVVSAVLTILILVFTEIIPKTIGARYWRGLSRPSLYLIKVFIVLTYPLVYLSAIVTRAISAGDTGNTTSRDEISALASIGATEGIFSEKEHKIIQNVLRLKNIRVTQIMTPRVVMAVADEDMSVFEFMQDKDYLKYSRIPVYHEETENVTGYVFRQEVFEKLAEDNHNMTLREIRREIAMIPNTNTLYVVWERLLEMKEHIALIVDEYGGVDGIVTLEDIIETLLGLEILDEKDTVTDMQKFARDRWKMRQAKYNMIDKIAGDSKE